MPRARSMSSTSSQAQAGHHVDSHSITTSGSGSKNTLRDKIKKIGKKNKHHDDAYDSPLSIRSQQQSGPGEIGARQANSPTRQGRAASMSPKHTPLMAPELDRSHAITLPQSATVLSIGTNSTGVLTPRAAREETPGRGRIATPRSRPSSPVRSPISSDLKRPGSGVASTTPADPVLSLPIISTDMRSSAVPGQIAEERYQNTPPPIMSSAQDVSHSGIRPGTGGLQSGGTSAITSSAGGFFSSVLSAAHSVLGTQPADDHATPSRGGDDASQLNNRQNDSTTPAQDSSPPHRAPSNPTPSARVARIAEELSPSSTPLETKNRELRSGSLMSRRRRESNASALFGPLETAGQPQKITGFAVASNKRNREFHATFRSVPEGDYLLDDYGCALQKEILVHGRMYVSESHICFNSNIFGWVTNLVIAFHDIISIEKRSTAGIFPNAIQLSTSTAKHIFASFISRETTYELIISIWRLTHPSVQTTPHGVEVVPIEDDESDEGSSHASGDEDEDDLGSDSSVQDSDPDFAVEEEALSNNSNSPLMTAQPSQKVPALEKGDAADGSELEFPGPREHAPTEPPGLADTSKFPRALVDQTIDAPLGLVTQILIGSDVNFMTDFLENNQKLMDVKVAGIQEPAKGKSRKISYVKPLSGPVGPKQTRCLIDESIELYDLERAIQFTTSTTSPDVPSGDAFVIKTRVCLMWGPRNMTRVVCHCNIEWSKSSWIKGVIEKASTSGQVDYWTQLIDAVRGEVPAGGKRKRAKKTSRPRGKSSADEEDGTATSPAPTAGDSAGGLMSSIMGLFSHVNVNLLLFIVMFGMMLTMVRMQRSIYSLSKDSLRSSDTPLASAERWSGEERDLWRWLASRTKVQSPMSGQLPVTDLTGLQLQEAIEQERIRLAVLMQAAEQGREKARPD